MNACMHAYIHTYIHIHMHTCIYLYIYIHIYLFGVYIYMYTYIWALKGVAISQLGSIHNTRRIPELYLEPLGKLQLP